MFTTTEVLAVTPDTDNFHYIVTCKQTKGLFFKRETIIKYRGSGTVWRIYPSAIRVDSFMESFLLTAVARYYNKQREDKDE